MGGLKKFLVGKVVHYYPKIGVAVVELSGELKVGDSVSFEGASTNFSQTISSMQVEHEKIDSAASGQAIGLKLEERARAGDSVYKIME